MFSKNSQRTRSFVVIGLGRFGGAVATELTRLGNRVLGIDSDEAAVARYADQLSDVAVADARDEDAIKESGAGAYDVGVVGIGVNLEANILCTMNLRLAGMDTIWVKAQNRTHHRILSRLHVDRVIEPEREIGAHVAQLLHMPMMRDSASLGNGRHVQVLVVPERLRGHPLSPPEVEHQHDIRVLSLMRGDQLLPLTEPAQLAPDDRLILLGRPEALRSFAKTL